MSPVQHRPEGSRLDVWSKLVESVRKDVECTFGILKKRFHILKHDIRLHNKDHVHDVFVACCILHNMLLDYDEWDDWETLPIITDDDVDEHEEDDGLENAGIGVSFIHCTNCRSGSSTSREKKAYEDRRDGLVEHYLYSKDNALTHWAR